MTNGREKSDPAIYADDITPGLDPGAGFEHESDAAAS